MGYRIYVISAEANFTSIFIGPDTCEKPLTLLLFKKHYSVITSMAALFNRSYFCWCCLKGDYESEGKILMAPMLVCFKELRTGPHTIVSVLVIVAEMRLVNLLQILCGWSAIGVANFSRGKPVKGYTCLTGHARQFNDVIFVCYRYDWESTTNVDCVHVRIVNRW